MSASLIGRSGAIDLVRDHPELITSIQRTLGKGTPALVVLDTLNRSIRGSESDDKDMTAFIRAADTIGRPSDVPS